MRSQRFYRRGTAQTWCWVAAVGLLASGCGAGRVELGKGKMSGVLPRKWEAAPVSGNQIVRVIRLEVPIPQELVVYPAAEGVAAPSGKGWSFVEEATRPGPTVRVGPRMQATTRAVRIYRARLAGGRVFEAAVDKRLDAGRAERFLASLREVEAHAR